MGNPWVRRQLPKSHPRVSARVRATKFHILLFLPGDIFDASLLQIGPYWWSRGLESNLHDFSSTSLLHGNLLAKQGQFRKGSDVVRPSGTRKFF